MRRASAVKLPTGGVELLRRLVFWLSNTQPVACLDPFPFINEYARIRPWDARGIHNAELFPMLAEDGILAILFPYTPVGFETSLLLSPPAHSLFCLASVVLAEPPPTPDFGFEDVSSEGGLFKWKVNTSGNMFESVTVVTADPRFVRSGKHAVKLAQTTPGKDGPNTGHLYSVDSIPIQPGNAYDLTFWVKGKGVTSGMVYFYQMKDGNEAFHSSAHLIRTNEEPGQGNTVNDEKDWHQFKFRVADYHVPAGAIALRVVVEAPGTVYIDDVTFSEAKSKAPKDKTKPVPSADASAPKEVEAKATPTKPILLPNLLSVGAAVRAPKIDGRVEEGEYATRTTGLLDNTTRGIYAFANTTQRKSRTTRSDCTSRFV